MNAIGIRRHCAALALLSVLGASSVARAQQDATPPAAPQTAAQDAGAQTAHSIVDRMNRVYTQAKTTQLTFQADVAANTGAASLVLHIVRSGSKSRIEVAPVGQGTGDIAKSLAQAHFLIITDGKTEYSLQSDNTYTRQPQEKKSTGFGGFDFASSEGTLTLSPPVTLSGHPVYVVNLSSKKEADKDPVVFQMTYYIDQATYRLRKLEAAGGDGKNSIRFSIAVSAETFNQPVSDRLFQFAPPVGAKQIRALAQNPTNPFQIALAGITGGASADKQQH